MNIYNQFKKNIGMYDATNEYIELIRRDFIERITNEENTDSFLLELATKHNIRLNEYRIDKVNNTIIRNYIVSVNLCFETFLKELNERGKMYAVSWKEKKQSDSWLKCIYDNILNDKGKYQDLFMLCEYYRGIRNLSVHDLKHIKQNVTIENLKMYQEIYKEKFPKLDAPNGNDNLNFDDFIIYTRGAKELGQILYDNINYDINKIVDLFNIKKYNGIKNCKIKLRNAIYQQIKMEFQLSNENMVECIDKIISRYYEAC